MSSPATPRRRASDRAQTAERNALADSLPLDSDLIQAVAKNARENAVNSKITTWLTGTVALMSVLIAMLGVTIVVLIVSISQTNRSLKVIQGIGVTNRANSNALRDCSTPGGVCYERQQQRIEAAVAELNHTMVVVGTCLGRSKTQQATVACVNRETHTRAPR